MTTQSQSKSFVSPNARITRIIQSNLYRFSGAAGVITGIIMLAAMISLTASALRPDASSSIASDLQNLWLIVIFKLHAGFSGVHIDSLHVMNDLDLAILGSVGVMFLGLYTALKPAGKILAIIAAIQPFLGMVIFIATKSAGRSAVMGAALVISIVMLRSKIFNKVTAYLGILASVLLLAGDFSAGVLPPSAILAILVGIGYLSLMIWFFLVARRLFLSTKEERPSIH